ncbi:hypothetical protein [Silvanigrella sp.]|uniref:hypothetical protein n=1 Tax=Silvanigrella sp. TaxID=2024976 RepID=UPI0037CC78B3
MNLYPQRNTMPPSRNIPNLVYRASITEPIYTYIFGITRSRGREISTDISNYILNYYINLQDNSAEYYNNQNPINERIGTRSQNSFISTYSSSSNAYRDAFQFVRAYSSNFDNSPRILTIYVYAIRPSDNFVSVTETYERVFQSAQHNTTLHENLRRLDGMYNNEDQYLAIGNIASSQIAYADEYRYNYLRRRYEYSERIHNVNFNNPNSELRANNYPIGTIPEPERLPEQNNSQSQMTCNIPSRPNNGTDTRQKRNTLENQDIVNTEICPTLNIDESAKILAPSDLFKNKAIEISVLDNYGKKICLAPYDFYLSYSECNNKNKWLYTTTGQLISEVNDGKYSQYYCLSKGHKDDEYPLYPRMKICDLNDRDQIWQFLGNKKDGFTLSLKSGEKLKLNENGYFINFNNSSSRLKSIKIENYEEIFLNISDPLIQFSVNVNFNIKYYHYEIVFSKNYFIIRATNKIYSEYKGMYSDTIKNKPEYINYYNAHNHAFFSNYGYLNTNGPQVCYTSNQVLSGSPAWDWVSVEYCSTKDFIENKYQWYFKNKNGIYQIFDAGNNVLRHNGDKTYFYTAGNMWTDSKKFYQSYLLDEILKNYINKINEKISISNGNENLKKENVNFYGLISVQRHFEDLAK